METMLDRVEKRLLETGQSAAAVSLLVSEGKSPDVIRDLRRRGTVPKGEAFDRLAEALETTVAYLRHGKVTDITVADRRTGYDAGPRAAPFAEPLRRDLPVYGTALGGDVSFEREDMIETHILELTDAIDWAERPPILVGRKDVYALYISGNSMEPRHEPGDLVVIDPKQPPRPGEDVIVQISDPDQEPGVKGALIKRLVRRTSEYVELRQYEPAMVFRVPVRRIVSLHRVLRMNDVIG